MLELERHRREYCYDLFTTVKDALPEHLCSQYAERVDQLIVSNQVQLVDHQGLGTAKELDAGGRYFHHILKGADIRRHLPELESAYHAFLPTVSAVTLQDVIVSPYPDSDINIKAYPAGGGTIGRHFDTNGISVLLYLTTNREGALVLELEHNHPSYTSTQKEEVKILPKAGSLLIMQGRRIWHYCDPLVLERKMVVVFNYYVKGDVWRPSHFDALVYDGVKLGARV